ncbi:MAG TPA: HlyD family efflux transporter periplasmic adaptor subunit [Burkholderiales bacterium]|jgi:HlyD family secretion protein|nr:HlyD family efflux transporter periplasmic adaptor subunit [Burkholderiales bacterium]
MKRLLIAFALLAGCGNQPNDTWQGYIEGEYVLLASPYAGQLQKLHVRRGERIETGKPVFALEQESERAARLEAEERLKAAQARLGNLKVPKRPPEIEALRAQLNQARAARDLAALQLEQAEKLFKESFVAQTRLDEARATHERELARVREAEAQLKTALQPLGRDAEREAAESEVEAAKAALAQAAWRLEQKSVAAPVGGLVHETFFVEGEWVPAGRPVAALLPPGNVKARFYVPEASLSAVSVGKDIEIRCDGCPAPIGAKVTYVSNQAEYTPPVLFSRESRAKLMFLVEARLQGTNLRPGQPVDVKLK